MKYYASRHRVEGRITYAQQRQCHSRMGRARNYSHYMSAHLIQHQFAYEQIYYCYVVPCVWVIYIHTNMLYTYASCGSMDGIYYNVLCVVLSANDIPQHIHKHQTMKIASIIALWAPLCTHNTSTQCLQQECRVCVRLRLRMLVCTCFLKHHHDLWRTNTRHCEWERTAPPLLPCAMFAGRRRWHASDCAMKQ